MAKIRLTLPSRVMIVLALGLVLAGGFGEVLGAKVESRFSGAVNVEGPGEAAMIALLTLTSSGYVTVTIEGGGSVYYFKIAGSPLTAMNQVTSLGVEVVNQRFVYDFRAGFGYGDAILRADRALLTVLPLVSPNIREAAQTSGGAHVVREAVDAGQGLAIIVVGGSGVVEYRGAFTVSEYYRMGIEEASAVAAVAILAALALAAPPLKIRGVKAKFQGGLGGG